jgi:hypothetical protein
MRLRKVIRKAIRHSGRGTNVAGGVHLVVAANVDEPGEARTSVSSRQRVIQRQDRSGMTSDEPQDRRRSGAGEANTGGKQ